MVEGVEQSGRYQNCPHCNTALDMSDEEPLSEVICPSCQLGVRVEGVFNHFTLQEKIGSGGMGSVYRAMDRNLNRQVALKLLRPQSATDQDHFAELEREARVTASITHPNVVRVFSYGADHGMFYLAMELVDKGSLDDLITRQKRLGELQVLEIGIQIARGLDAACQKGLIHRDVKPGNILFADAQTAKIVDFGLALLMEQEAEARGEIWGTPYYVAPEKLNQKPEDLRSDIYSLGATLFHAIAGRPPFEAQTASLVALKHLKSQAVSLQSFAPDASDHTAYVINRMLSKDPENRQQSYSELIEQLEYARARVASTTGRPRQPKERINTAATRQTTTVVAALSALMLLIVAVGGFFAYRYAGQMFGTAQSARDERGVRLQGSSQQVYNRGVQLILAQRFPEAAELLESLLEQRELAQPLENWTLLHQGMALYLDNRPDEARQVFRTVFEAGLYSEEERQIQTANFFVETARLLQERDRIPPTILRIYNRNSIEAISIFLFGLANWQAGAFEDAKQLLQASQNVRLPSDLEWIERYSDLAGELVHDLDIILKLEAEDMSPLARETAAAAALEKLNFAGPVRDQLREMAGLPVEAAPES